MLRSLASQSALAVLRFIFPKWMEGLRQEVLEEMRAEEYCRDLLAQVEARKGGLGDAISYAVRQNRTRV
jgi:hypothetical protein